MSIDKISMERIAERILPVHFRTTEPVLILGEPGIGKTEIVLQSIRELLEEAYAPKKGKDDFNVKNYYTIIDGSGMPSESLVIPYIDNDHVNRLQRDVIPEFKKAKAFF